MAWELLCWTTVCFGVYIIPYTWYGLFKSIECDINNRTTNLIITVLLLQVLYVGPVHGCWSTSDGGGGGGGCYRCDILNIPVTVAQFSRIIVL